MRLWGWWLGLFSQTPEDDARLDAREDVLRQRAAEDYKRRYDAAYDAEVERLRCEP